MPRNTDIDKNNLLEVLEILLKTPSPTGFCEQAIAYIENTFSTLGLSSTRTVKGGMITEWVGAADDTPRAVTAHVDTLGAMVKEIKPNGRLKLSKIGSFSWNTVEGEGCSVFTTSGEVVRGSLLLTKASTHIHGIDVSELKRDSDHLELRLDERTSSEQETLALGIGVGDFIAFDPRVEISSSGFIRSRHLDDKAGVACILAAAKTMLEAGMKPSQRTTLHISNYEEVGHGAASGFSSDIVELVAVDIAPVGEGQASDEFHTTICVKDSGGPYHVELTRHLQEIASKADIPTTMDIYPHYGSDAEAYWRAGGDVRIALIGPGVDATHNYERTHLEALIATTRLIMAYLRS
jgi:putative aminopeptidase FrvX